MTHDPSVADLALQPQLSVLCVVDVALRHATLALHAAHQDVLVQACNPDAPEQPRLAAAIIAGAEALRHLLDQYRIATEHKTIESIPY